MTRVVVSTHLDDAVFSCFAAVVAAVRVVTVFAGVPPAGVAGDWDRACGARDGATRMLERRDEDGRALAGTGAEPVHLDLLERQHTQALGIPAAGPATVADVLRPRLVHADDVYAPAGIGHPEHAAVRDAVLSLRPDAVLYADIPYALVSPDGFALPPDAPDGRAQVERTLPPELVAAKLAACRRYATQLPALTALHGGFATADALAREVTWHAVARG